VDETCRLRVLFSLPTPLCNNHAYLFLCKADDGAVGALAKHSSLLAAGIVGVEGAIMLGGGSPGCVVIVARIFDSTIAVVAANGARDGDGDGSDVQAILLSMRPSASATVPV
jgi:hypothetical protein